MGLYDGVKTTTGEFSDWDYLNPKYSFEMLEAALTSRQPESRIAVLVAKLLNEIAAAGTKYPDLVELKKWKDKAVEVDGKVNKEAPSAPWKSPFADTWDQQVHKELWAPYHKARAEVQAEDWKQVLKECESFLSNYARQADPKADNSFAKMYRDVSDDQKQRFAGYVAEMKALKAQAEKKLD